MYIKLFLLLISFFCWGQTNDTLKKFSIEKVDIYRKSRKLIIKNNLNTSLRLPNKLIEIPQNISVATEQSLKYFSVNGSSEFTKFTSGIIKNYGQNNDFSFSIRGTDATYNIYRNGIGNYWWNVQADSYMIDRLEFVKGPTGFLISNAEPGGIMNEVLKTADGNSHLDYMLGMGNYNLFRNGLDIGNKINDKISYRIVVGGQNTGAINDFYRSYRTYVIPSFKYDYKKNSFIELLYMRVDGKSENESYSNASLDGKKFLFSKKFNISDPNINTDIITDDFMYKINFQHEFKNGWHLKGHYGFVDGLYDGQYMYTIDFTPNFNTAIRDLYIIKLNNNVENALLSLNGDWKQNDLFYHQLLIGLDYGNTSLKRQTGYLNYLSGQEYFNLDTQNPNYNLSNSNLPNTIKDPIEKSFTKWYGFYIQDHLKIKQSFIITLASRITSFNRNQESDNLEESEFKLIPRLGLTYLFSLKNSIYSIYEKFYIPQLSFLENNKIASALNGNAFEIGYKSELDSRMFLTTSLFYTVKNNVLTQNPISGINEQVGQFVSKGFEIASTGTLFSKLNYNINYAYTDAKITNDSDSNNIGFTSNSVPKHLINSNFRYQLLTLKNLKAYIGLGNQFFIKRSASLLGTTSQNDKKVVFPNYCILDGLIGFEYKNLEFQTTFFNITNTNYFNTGWYISPDSTTNRPGYYTGDVGNPFNLRFVLYYSFL